MDNSSSEGPELFFGLVGPVGADLQKVTDYLSASLRRVRYTPEPLIHLASLLRDAGGRWASLPKTPLDVYINTHMTGGDELRESTGLNDAMAILGIGAIQKERTSRLQEAHSSASPDSETLRRRAFIIRSLKHPAEVQTLRDVYGPAFYVVAVHGCHHDRVEHLAKQIAKSHGSMGGPDDFKGMAEDLIRRDLEELDIPHGQKLRDTFHRADVFFDIGREGTTLQGEIERFVELIFGNLFRTPTKAEYAMFHAAAAALRSAEPGRQVGAAIATDDGDIVAVGTNEVPKSHGGLYWCDDTIDRRQFQLGEDSNQAQKRILIAETLEYLREAKWLRTDLMTLSRDELLREALDVEKPALPRRSQIRGLIEFGRAVHAEMAALIDAARRGVSVQGTTMYVTTFPCHLCARHIVAAGIKAVYYIEPYPKSLARTLYPDSIALEPADRTGFITNQIPFEPFVGVAPRLYFDLFSAPERRRKDDSLNLFDANTAVPRFAAIPRVYIDKEKLMRAVLSNQLQRTLFPLNMD